MYNSSSFIVEKGRHTLRAAVLEILNKTTLVTLNGSFQEKASGLEKA